MWSNPQETADLLTLVKKSLMKNYIFLCSVRYRTKNHAKNNILMPPNATQKTFQIDKFLIRNTLLNFSPILRTEFNCFKAKKLI